MPSENYNQVVKMLLENPVTSTSIEHQRQTYEAALSATQAPTSTRADTLMVGDLSLERIDGTSTASSTVILYLHGGGYSIGSAAAYRGFGGVLCVQTASTVVIPDYRKAPEHPFPAALEDALSAYAWLLAQGYSESDIVVGGDSAGGGLALALLFSLRDKGKSLPRCIFLFSPWTDLVATGSSIADNAQEDPVVSPEALRRAAQYYAPDNPHAPMVSPLYGDFTGLPAMLVQVGTREVLLDDSRRTVSRARSQGVTVEYFEYDGLVHVWPVLAPFTEEAEQALQRVNDFLE